MKHNYLTTMLLMLLCTLTLPLASCSDDGDDQEPIGPLSSESVQGLYSGTVSVRGGEAAAASVTVGEDFVISDFPVDTIVKAAIPEQYLAQATVAEPVGLTIGYETSIFGLNLFTTFSTADIAFDVAYGGATHSIAATIYAEERGSYNATDRSLQFELMVQSIALDGQPVVFSSIPYQYEMTQNYSSLVSIQ